MAPSKPTGLTATPWGSDTIILRWDDTGTGEDSLIRIWVNGLVYTQTSGDKTSYTFDGLQDGTTYTFVIGCATYDGVTWQWSPDSDPCTGTTNLNAPTGLEGTASDTSVTLRWTDNSQNESGFEIWRNGSSIGTVGANVTTFNDTGLAQGTWYEYEVNAYNADTRSGGSNTLRIITEDPPSKPLNLAAVATGTSTITLTWSDASDNETAQYVERSATSATAGFSAIATLGANITTYADSGLTSNTRYWYRVRAHNDAGYSSYSDVAYATTFAAIAQPTNLQAVAISGTVVELTFQDNSELEDCHCVERGGGFSGEKLTNGNLETWSSATNAGTWGEALTGSSTINREATSPHGGTYCARIDTDSSANVAYLYQAVTLSAGAAHRLTFWYKTSGGSNAYFQLCDSGPNVYLKEDGTWVAAAYSILLPAASSWTLFTLDFTSHTTYTAYSLNLLIPTLASCSAYVDDVSLLGSSMAEIVQLEPNRTFYRDTGLSAGTSYTYRVRAKQGASSYSAYSDEVSVTTLSVPGAPSGLAVTEYQDTWIRIGWTAATGTVTGYKIEQNIAGAGWVEIAVVADGVLSYKAAGLTASVSHQYQVRAYNGTGNSSYSGTVTQTTRAAYSPSKFEKLLRKSNPRLVYLVEVNPLMPLDGWAATSGRLYTYGLTVTEELDALYENGVALTLKTSLSEVEAYAGTWYQDVWTGATYIHPTGSDAPANYTYTGSLWLYFTSWQDGSTTYNDKLYLPLVASDGIPDISQEIQRYHEGTFVISSGSVGLVNGRVAGSHYFDTRSARYLWRNRKVQILAGSVGFTYAEFQIINTGLVSAASITDQRFTLTLRDARDSIHRNIPSARYTAAEFPKIDANAIDKPRPFAYGTITNAVPIQIDTTNRVFEFHAGRCKSVTQVTKNGVALTGGTDYFIDYQRGRFTLARGMTYSSDDVILVDFHGHANSADEELTNGADLFLHFMTSHLGVSLADLDLDSIYATKLARTTTLAAYLYKDQSSQEIIRRLEHSIRADSYQDAQGRLGFKAAISTAPSDIIYIPEAAVSDLEKTQDKEDIYSEIDIFHSENPKLDVLTRAQRLNPAATWKHGVTRSLDLDTYLASSTDADTLGAAVLALLEKDVVRFSVNRCLFRTMPGDLVYLTRGRYYSNSGTASNLLLRVLSVGKSFSGGRTEITAEEV